MRSAIRRRKPITLISDVSAETSARFGAACAAAAGAAADGRPAAVRSSRRIRPPGPEPTTVDRSMPASRARRRLAGDVMTRPWRAAGAAMADGTAADAGTALGAGATLRAGATLGAGATTAAGLGVLTGAVSRG